MNNIGHPQFNPDRGTTHYEYDVSGNQIKVTDANSNIKTISYDLLKGNNGQPYAHNQKPTVSPVG